MDKLRVFVSSTCYDLHHLRRDLEEFVHDMGYEPVLSDSKTVAIPPGLDNLDACKWLVRSAEIFVLVIGGRYGHTDPSSGKSITNVEYETAFQIGMPIYTFVDAEVWSKRGVYKRLLEMVKEGHLAKDKMGVMLGEKIEQPEVFEFIDQVANASRDSWIHEFSAAREIVEALKRSWSLLFKDRLFDNRSSHASKPRPDLSPQLKISWLGDEGGLLGALSFEPVPNWNKDEIISRLKSLRSNEDLRRDWRKDLATTTTPNSVDPLSRFIRRLDEMIMLATSDFDTFRWRCSLRKRSFVVRLQITNEGTAPANGVVVFLDPSDEVSFCDLTILEDLSFALSDDIIAAAKSRDLKFLGDLGLDAIFDLPSVSSGVPGLAGPHKRFEFVMEKERVRIDLSSSLKHNFVEMIDLKSLFICLRQGAQRRIELPYECHADNLPSPSRGSLIVTS